MGNNSCDQPIVDVKYEGMYTKQQALKYLEIDYPQHEWQEILNDERGLTPKTVETRQEQQRNSLPPQNQSRPAQLPKAFRVSLVVSPYAMCHDIQINAKDQTQQFYIGVSDQGKHKLRRSSVSERRRGKRLLFQFSQPRRMVLQKIQVLVNFKDQVVVTVGRLPMVGVRVQQKILHQEARFVAGTTTFTVEEIAEERLLLDYFHCGKHLKMEFAHRADYVVGSGALNYLQVADEAMSASHFRLERRAEEWLVVDCESLNGLFWLQSYLRFEWGQRWMYNLSQFQIKVVEPTQPPI